MRNITQMMFDFQGEVAILENIPFNYRERNPRLFEISHNANSNRNYNRGIQRTNPSMLPEPGVNDEIVRGKVRCITDDERYYDPRCYSFEGSGKGEM